MNVAGIALLIIVMIVLRVVYLDSDSYYNLTWNSELVTDEGFYCHDARDRIVFGRSDLPGDNFHNALIMPLLHGLQLLVFRAFGFGLVQARCISVVISLLTLALFFAACRRVFGLRAGLLASLLLGLDHTNLLYNRMALMDTPAQLPLVACFYCFVRAIQIETADVKQHDARTRAPVGPFVWWLAVGLCLMVAYATRGLSALLAPVPLAMCWIAGERKQALRRAGGIAAGLALGALIYGILWYAPHRAELAEVNHFYVGQQLLPHSLASIRQNIGHSLFGNQRGYSAYLVRHSPVQFALLLFWLLTWRARQKRQAVDLTDWPVRERSSKPPDRTAKAAALFLTGWVFIFLLTYSLVRYSAPRYYVLFYPAMAALSALALTDLPEILAAIWRSVLLRTALGTFFSYHIAEAFLEHRHDVLLYGLTITAAIFLLGWDRFLAGRRAIPPPPGPLLHKEGERFETPLLGKEREKIISPVGLEEGAYQNSPLLMEERVGGGGRPVYWMIALSLWALVNAGWLAHWLTHIGYTQRDADLWLDRNLPSNAVIIGDAAPGLSLRNNRMAVNVIPGLCNDKQPLEAFAGQPRYILIFDSPTPMRWWQKRYPQYIIRERRMHRFILLHKFIVDLYAGN